MANLRWQELPHVLIERPEPRGEEQRFGIGRPVPVGDPAADPLRNWLLQLQRNIVELSTTIGQFDVLTSAPDKPRRGLVVYADGTDWNPGSGEGLYRYNGSTWVFIG